MEPNKLIVQDIAILLTKINNQAGVNSFIDWHHLTPTFLLFAIDATKLEKELGWLADEDFDSGIFKTLEWYLKKYE